MRFIIVILSFTVFSCSSKKKEIPPVEFFYDIRVEELRAEKMMDCKYDAIEKAEKFVDSLIDKWIKEQNNQEVDFPIKPPRPSAPDKIIGKEN